MLSTSPNKDIEKYTKSATKVRSTIKENEKHRFNISACLDKDIIGTIFEPVDVKMDDDEMRQGCDTHEEQLLESAAQFTEFEANEDSKDQVRIMTARKASSALPTPFICKTRDFI